jgi:carbon starvation protein
MRPRAFLTSLLLVLLLALFYVALVLEHPALVAPEFHGYASSRGALPWLFLLIGAGALAGWQLLIVYGVTGRELRRETDARYVGYGAALAQGLVALSALLLGAVAFVGPAEWTRHYAAAPGAGDLPAATAFYVNALARHLGALGLDAQTARVLGATVLAGLSLAVLEAGVRALSRLLRDARADGAGDGGQAGARRRLWLIVGAAAVVALHDGRGLGGLRLWPLLALGSLWLAAAGFALMAAALRHAARPALLPALLALAASLLAAWAGAAQLWAWWRAGAWPAAGAGLLLFVLAAAWLREAAAAAWAQGRRTELDT